MTNNSTEKKSIQQIIILFTSIFIILSSGSLYILHSEQLTPQELVDEISSPSESDWMGIYLNDNKIGYVYSELKPIPDGGYEIINISRISGAVMGKQQVMLTRMTTITDSMFALVSFDCCLDATPYVTFYTGEIKDKILFIQVEKIGGSTEKIQTASKPFYLSPIIEPILQLGKLPKGDTLRLSEFDPLSMQMQDLFVINKGKTTRTINGEDMVVLQLTTIMLGLESTIYLDEEYNTIEEFGPMGLVMRREDMEQALNLENGSGKIDFLSIYSIQPVGTIKAPRSVTHARYRITGFNIQKAISISDRQNSVDFNSNIIKVADKYQPSDISVEDIKAFTTDSPYIESNDPQIIQAAQEAMRNGSSRLDSLNRLTDWVFRTITKKPSVGIPSALAILKTRRGDCNEHSTLFTALSRSVGIPTRMHLGVVYQKGRFYYHAWTAAWVEGCWMEFEPTFGSKTVDAARIALTSGDLTNSLDLAAAIGKIKIEILEAE
ncbi:MAG: transglutaminase-like domain-containing protein [Candidatus Hatepunaea meridiana]|nr:transglutaminase-like domain-containing protein [Candidatus Hatepunaea meridiana]